MNKIIVVEGKSDTRRLKEIFPNIQTFETSGLGYDHEKEKELINLSRKFELIIFTDPDGPGEIIRSRIKKTIPNCKHAYLPNKKAISKKCKIGIEHGKKEDIIKALDNLYVVTPNRKNYKIADLVEYGIYNSREKRKVFCDRLGIAYGNNKKVLKQLNEFNISLERIEKVIWRENDSSQ